MTQDSPAPFYFSPSGWLAWANAFALVALSCGSALPLEAAEVDCADTGQALAYWRPLREQGVAATLPNQLAPALVGCLKSGDAELRDGIGYELFAVWLRGEQLDDDTRRKLLADLRSLLNEAPPAVPGDATFGRSFGALVLAEVLRSDAYQPFMSSAERNSLLDDALRALDRENDFRGLTKAHGWVHPVAHIADLLWRFALHPGSAAGEAERLLQGLRVKTGPTEAAYAFNEGDRLARVASTVIARQLLSTDEISAWLDQFATPQSMAAWSDAFASPEGMTELHNTKQFLRALSDQLEDADIDPRIEEKLTALVQEFTALI